MMRAMNTVPCRTPLAALMGLCTAVGALGCEGNSGVLSDLQGSNTGTPGVSQTASPGPGATASPGPASSPTPTPTPTPTPSPSVSPSCATAGLQVCDDFETEASGAAPDTQLWRVSTINAQESIVVDAAHAYRGRQALHVHTTNVNFERAEIVNTSIFPAPSNRFFGRMFIYFDSDAPQIHCNLVRGAGVRPGETQQASYNVGTQFQIFLDGYYDANNSASIIDEGRHAGVNSGGAWQNATYLPTRRWTCLEWEFDGAGNNLHVWLDSQALTLLDTLNGVPYGPNESPWIAPPFTEVGLGWTVVGNSENFDHFDVWLDAVALDPNRIGCDR